MEKRWQSMTIKPNLKFLLKHPAHFIALGMGSGLFPVAPGTAGTVFAWGSFLGLSWLFNQIVISAFLWPVIIFLSFLLGLWACRVTSDDMGVQDPGAIVWDEVVGFWLVLYSLWFIAPASFGMQAFAFCMFRLFDMVKKGPVRWADQQFKGSGYKNAFGIMLDDIVAALLAIVVIYLTQILWALYV